MKVKEYTVPELSEYIESLRSLYDIVRLVAPESCRVIELDHDCYAFGKKCFGFTKMDPEEIPGLKKRM